MPEESGLPNLMSSLSTKANDLVTELSRLRSQNTGLRTETSILRKQRNELHTRVLELEAAVLKHQATEARLQKSLHSISDTLSLAETPSEKHPMSKNTITFGPSTAQTTFFNKGTSNPPGSKRVAFGKTTTYEDSNDLNASSPSGTASDSGSSFGNKTFGSKTGATAPSGAFGTPFGTPKYCNDPFNITTVQQTFSSSPEKGFSQNTSDSTEDGKNFKLASTTVGPPSAKPSTEANSRAVEPNCFRGTTVFSFGGVPSNNALAAKAEPVAETDETNKIASPFDENTQQNLSGTSQTAFYSNQTGGSSEMKHGEAINVHGSRKELPKEKESGETNSNEFPLPTPLSRRTFGLQPISDVNATAAKEEKEDPRKAPVNPTLPPPRSVSFPHSVSCVEGETYETISQMPYFKMYSVEEIRLWDYVNRDMGPLRI